MAREWEERRRGDPKARAAIAGSAVFLLSACSVVLEPSEDQCQNADDCKARGYATAQCVGNVCVDPNAGGGGQGGGDPIWGCVGNVIEPTPDTSKMVTIEFKLLFATDEKPLTGGTVDVCDKLDITCMNMSAEFPKGLTPAVDGSLSINVKQGFDGFVRVTSPDIVDSRIYVGRPVIEPPKVKSVQLLRPMEYSVLANLAQDEVDPTRGTAILLAVDCNGDAGGGIKFKSPNVLMNDETVTEFYLVNQSPVPTAKKTDKDGFGGFFNMKVGSTVAQSYLAGATDGPADDVFVGESSFQILANTISYVQIAPTPQ
jgi:hypothetical protein